MFINSSKPTIIVKQLRSMNRVFKHIYKFTIKTNKMQQPTLRLPSFSHFPLHASLVEYLEARDIHTPTFIQYALLSKLHNENSSILANRTVIKTNYHLISPTGTGKTLAYLIPIFNHLKMEQERCKQILTKPQRPRAIILTSNKELVLQARNVAKDISHFAKLKCEGLGIGRTLQKEKQLLDQSGVDILITPYARFKRMLDNREVFLSMLRWVVVDQVDTIFEGQKSMMQDIYQTILQPKVIDLSPSRQQFEEQPKLRGILEERQFIEQAAATRLILSSTTNPLPLRQFLMKRLQNKRTIKTIPQQSSTQSVDKKYLINFQQIIDKNVHVNLQNIKHQFLHCQELNKHQTLLQELRRDRNGKIMIFCNTVSSLHDLQYFLSEQGISVFSLHSQLGKNIRLNNYQHFRDLDKGILLATDLGARGLDFPKLKKIINYDFPLSTCDYLQRAGRTGRAGGSGTVVSLYFKKHLEIINELKGASFSQPLKINNSAYGFKNREETQRSSKFSKKSNKN